MFIADGGGGGTTPTTLPDYAGAQRKLSIEPSAIPAARKVFSDALNQLEARLTDAMTQLEAKPWAGDPVSDETAQRFNRDTFEAGDSAGLVALKAYREQLKGVVEQLTAIEADYRRVEGDNTASWGRINNG
ncbi:transcriptional regulator [Saccharothrix sp. S26]|uniref:transcriptional regulator n=1 Tax=Saccharothrix sp. S26 TaxID=2907215 RepID=UPI001F34AAA3|nr:transcriptional regulator [Saccharothrix sp. S26]MCE6995724.1 transcriptional regulator [Saccharothrix sp. S26]